MFTSSLAEEVKALEEDIEAVKDKVEDPIMCEKIRQFVYAPKEIRDLLKADAGSFFLLVNDTLVYDIQTPQADENLNVLVVILRSSQPPALNRLQMQRVA